MNDYPKEKYKLVFTEKQRPQLIKKKTIGDSRLSKVLKR